MLCPAMCQGGMGNRFNILHETLAVSLPSYVQPFLLKVGVACTRLHPTFEWPAPPAPVSRPRNTQHFILVLPSNRQ